MTEIYIYIYIYIYEHEAIRIPKSENNIGAPSAPQKSLQLFNVGHTLSSLQRQHIETLSWIDSLHKEHGQNTVLDSLNKGTHKNTVLDSLHKEHSQNNVLEHACRAQGGAGDMEESTPGVPEHDRMCER